MKETDTNLRTQHGDSCFKDVRRGWDFLDLHGSSSRACQGPKSKENRQSRRAGSNRVSKWDY